MAPTHTKRPRLAASASFVGSALEYYDFFIYGTASALVFGKLFFPTANPALGTIAALATFAIGNIGRPIGAAVIGHYGDRIGRKQMLILTLIGMGVCTILIGCLPTYASIGIAAPILLLVLRLLQGIAVSGESGGAITLSMEHAPEHRRAFYASWVNQGAAAGSMLATLAFLGFSSLPAEQFESWGWRVPFLLSAVVVIVGLVIRAKLPESPEFEKVEDHHAVAKFPLVTVLTKQTSAVVRVVFIAVLTVVVPINQVLGLTYGVQSGIPRSTMLMIGLVSSALAILTQPVFAIIADRIGRKPVFLTGGWSPRPGRSCSLALWYRLRGRRAGRLGRDDADRLLDVQRDHPRLYAEMFDTRVRYSGVAVAGQLGQIFPGFAPAIAAGLLAGGGTGITVALFVAGCAAVSIITVLTARETKDVATDDLGGLRQRQVSAGAAVESVEVR